MQNITIKTAAACSLVICLLMSCASGPGASRRSLIVKGGIEEAVRQADTSLMMGDYKKALELYGDIYAIRKDKAMLERYFHACKQIQTAADQAFQKQDFAKAGSIYYILVAGGMMGKKFKGPLSLDRDYLSGQITACSRSLTEIGLVKYREEKLDEAISIWRNILAFDPDNKTVTKAIETASRQLQQLNRIQ